MKIQRFSAPSSREALAKARHAFGDSAVILSTRSTDDGFEVMAAAEESLAALTPPSAAGRQSPRAAAPLATAGDTVDEDTQTLAMSTLSFQEYVRERMLRKRRESASDASGQMPQTSQMPTPRAEPVLLPQRHAPVVAAAAQAPATLRSTHIRPESGQADAATPVRGIDLNQRAVALELCALKDMIEERFNTLTWLGASKQNPVQANLMLKLIRAGYSPSISRAVLERLPANSGAPEAVHWVIDVITRNLKVAATDAGLCDEGGVLALIGATGVGKTTTAAKIAAQCVKRFGAASVGIITLDTQRAAGYEQLRAYGRMLGVVAHQAHDHAALKDLLTLLANKRLVLIDTPGLGQRDQRIPDLLDLLALPKLKKCLLLNAGAHGDTLDEVLTAFKPSTLHGVVLSKVDEAVKLGPVLDVLIRHQVTLRGVSNGQGVPEDWQAPDAAAWVRMSLGSAGKSAFDPLPTDMGLYFAHSSTRHIDLGAAHV
ncbi:flagellar biosynthesis protein FlhF [Hydrogenophaga sp.]|uniref:flagellar biosynthesis protein FlhF n=1 Tax=Hydrogenophaga sp. TaxID=1904254 RepID=UPI00199E7CC7|nr:flagellar biosynthesis protein FlhF [Hydrogenophaga sp.]MBD3893116.1 flagellar biosynthesis protein FlhF [Hydrogenophaga sp.]